MPPRPSGRPPLAQASSQPGAIESAGAAARRRRIGGASGRTGGVIEVGRGSEALSALLAELGGRIRPGRRLAREVAGEPAVCPTGIAALDVLLGGGLPRGRLSELCGPPSSGRTSLAMALLVESLGRGALAAWIDPADAFDPASAAAALAGRGDLQRLLWIRARTAQEAIRSCERVLETEGFALTVLDLAHAAGDLTPPPPARARMRGRTAPDPGRAAAGRPVRASAWLRLTRLAARQRSALVVLSSAPQTDHHAELVLELRRRRSRFSGPPALLDALETTALLRRHRSRPLGRGVELSLSAELASDDDAAQR
ncbi:MAG: hypothetical protein R3F35_13675 [Myxococcota bacterium]